MRIFNENFFLIRQFIIFWRKRNWIFLSYTCKVKGKKLICLFFFLAFYCHFYSTAVNIITSIITKFQGDLDFHHFFFERNCPLKLLSRIAFTTTIRKEERNTQESGRIFMIICIYYSLLVFLSLSLFWFFYMHYHTASHNK